MPPSTPVNLQATAADGQVQLSWDASTGATSYSLYYNTTGSVSTADTAISAGTSTNYTHSSLTNNTTYYYVVVASNSGGSSAISAEVNATPFVVVPPVAPSGLVATPDAAQVTLDWGAVTGADSYTVYWDTTLSVTTASSSISAGTATSYVHTGLTNGTRHSYAVVASNAGGDSPLSAIVSATPVAIPTAPANLQATGGDTQITLSWDAVSEADQYIVYVGTTSGVTSADNSIGPTTNTTVDHTGIPNNMPFYYIVSAINSSGTAESSEVSAVALGTWAWAEPQPQGNRLNDVTWDGARYLAVGDAGTVVDQAGGIYTTNTTYHLKGIDWDGTRYIVVGELGTITITTDLSDWTDVSTGNNEALNAVDGIAGDIHVAVGDADAILLSVDNGSSWSSAVGTGLTTGIDFTDIANDGDNFVLVGLGGNIVKGVIVRIPGTDSSITWSESTSGTTEDLHAVSWNGSNLYTAVGANGAILTSADGTTWSAQTSGTTETLNEVTSSAGLYAVVGSNGTILTSGDAVTWTARVSGESVAIEAIGFDGITGLQSVGQGGVMVNSTDSGVNWGSSSSSSADYAVMNDAVWNGTASLYVAVGNGGNVMTSADGTIWTSRTSNTSANLNAVIWTGSLYIAAGDGGVITTSPDGTTWTAGSTAATEDLMGVAWDGSQYLVVGSNGTSGVVQTSPDTATWTTQLSPISGLNGVIWNGAATTPEFIAVGLDGIVMNSSDGISWSSNNYSTSALYSIAAYGDKLVAVGDAMTIIDYNPTTTNWTEQAYTPDNLPAGYPVPDLRGILHDGSMFLAVGSVGLAIASADGINWFSNFSGQGSSLNGVETDGSQYIGVGSDGAVLYY